MLFDLPVWANVAIYLVVGVPLTGLILFMAGALCGAEKLDLLRSLLLAAINDAVVAVNRRLDEDTAREIFDLNLSAEMVVLSACNTARGGNTSGEGIVGLTWALFAAGAPTQVVSQWSVSDESTAQLMI